MSELRIVRGNSFRTRIKVRALNPDGSVMDDFSLLDCTDLSLFAVRAWKAVRIKTWEIHSDDEIDVTWNAPYCMTIGIYGLEIMGRLDGAAWRFCNRDLFEVVETSAEANIPDGSFIEDGSYEMTADFQLVLRVGAVQSDWAVDDQSDPAYIKHKPDLDLYAQKTWVEQQGYITSETDPTVPSWAKQPNKPTYTAQEVGALPDTTVIPTALSQLSQDSTHRVVTDAQLSQIEFDHNKLDGTILDVVDIKAKIPAAASASNQLADKAWVDDNAAEVFVYEVDASNLVDGRKEVEDATVYPLLSSHEAAGDVVLVKLTNNASYPFVLPVIQRTSSTMLFAATLNGARLFTGYVEVYAEGYLIYCAAEEYYTKPSGGIPASDLAQAVRTSLQKADTALQSESDPVFAASPAHSITASDIAAWDAKADKVAVVNHGTSSTTLAIAPNVFHVWGTVSALNITLTAPTDSNVLNLYSFQFTSGSTPTNLTLPSGVQWPKDNALTVEANMVYEVNIRDNKATWSGWEVV